MKKYVRILLWILVLAWMAVIFSFSTENAEESSATSAAVIRRLLAVFDRGFSSLTPAEQFERMEAWSFAVRKTAHFTAFAILGLLSSAALSLDLSPRRAFPAALLLGALYAVSDEVHQFFVPGRACQLRDVLIDTAGVVTSLLLLFLLRKILRRGRAE